MEFRVLGPVEVRGDDGRVLPVAAARVRTVLATLLMRAHQPVSPDELVERLWDGDEPAKPYAAVQTYVRRLRGIIGHERVQTHPAGYLIAAEPADLAEFRRLVESAPQAADALTEREQLGKALALWRDDPLNDVTSVSLTRHEVPRLIEERLVAVERWLDVRLRLGEHADLVAELTTLIREHPLRERFRAQQMVALYRCGRQAEALSAYDELATTLSDELGIDPGPDAQRVRQAILVNDAELASPEPASLSMATDWQAQFQLPLDIADFVGRDSLIDTVERHLTGNRDSVPIVVLEGAPGVGKTALGLHVAHRLRAEFPDGQWYAGLRGAGASPSHPAAVLDDLLRSSGVPGSAVPEALEERSAAFRSRLADRRVLLFLDDARDAEQVRSLLPGVGGSAVVITSRQQLWSLTALHGALNVHVDVLDADEARTLVSRSLGPALCESESDAVADLVELCGALPLALRIAAANAASRGGRVAGYLAELRENRLTRLAIPGDQRTALRAAFDLSYAALDDESKHLFRVLGLVPGRDFSADTAAALLDAGADDAAERLERLVMANLVQRGAPGRYGLHDLIRIYAAERAVAGGEEDTALRRLFDWYLRTVDAAGEFGLRPTSRIPPDSAPYRPFADRAQALAWLDAELPNLVEATRHATAHHHYEVAWNLADALRMYLARRLMFEDWRTITESGLAAARAAEDRVAEGTMLGSLGALEQGLGNTHAAMRYADAGIACYRETGHQLGEALLSCNLGLGLGDVGEPRRAVESLQRGVSLLRSIGRADLLDIALLNLSALRIDLGELVRAVEDATESLACCRSESSRRAALVNRAQAHRLLGAYSAAQADLDSAQRIDEVMHEVSVLLEQANLQLDIGALGPARQHAEQALDDSRSAGRRVFEAEALNVLGEIHRLESDIALAQKLHTEALAIADAGSYRVDRVAAMIGLAAAARQAGDPDAADAYAQQGYELAGTLDLPVLACRAALLRTALAAEEGRPEDAADLDRTASALRTRTGYQPAVRDPL